MKNALHLVPFALTLCLVCGGTANAAQQFQANLDAAQVVSTTSTTTATAVANFVLNDDQTALSYSLVIDGMDLKMNPADRNQPNDVVAIHLHSAPIGTPGPHVLNIFGAPSMDDDGLVIDFAGESLTGSWDDADVVDPSPAGQSMGGTTKFLQDFLTELRAGNLYLAVHNYTDPSTPAGAVAIRGQLIPVPEPATAGMVLCAAVLLGSSSRRRI